MRDRRVNLLTSLRCNNHCVFCVGGDHFRADDPPGSSEFLSVEELERQLSQIPDPSTPVLFTGGEPTLNPRLLRLIQKTRALGFDHIGLQTNGRMLCYEDQGLRLIRAGAREFALSIHGSVKAIHEGMTRARGSFAQTLKGLENLLRLKSRFPRLKIATASTITRINLKDMEDLLRFLLGEPAIDVIVLNPLNPLGNGLRYYPQLRVSYSEMLGAFRKALAALRREGFAGLDRITWTDIPPCVMRGLGGHVGTFERVTVFLPGSGRLVELPEKQVYPGIKGPECRACTQEAACTGISPVYVRDFGWSEFVPC